MIKNIVFDIGNVLIEFHPAEAMRKVGIPEEKIEPLLRASVFNVWWQELDRGFLPEEEVQNYMIADHPELEKEMKLFFRESRPYLVEPYAYSEEWLKGLKERGYHLYLLSNYPVSYFDMHSRDKFTFMPYIDGQIVSGYVRKIKPDPDIYRLLLETYQLKPEECVFMDDRKENIAAASKLGFHTILFQDYTQVCKKLEAMLENKTKIC